VPPSADSIRPGLFCASTPNSSASSSGSLTALQLNRTNAWARRGGARLIYLADPALARRHLETDAVELGVLGMKAIAPLRVEGYRRFMASHSLFVVYGRHRAWDWLSDELQAEGASTRVIARNSQNGAPLIEVTR